MKKGIFSKIVVVVVAFLFGIGATKSYDLRNTKTSAEIFETKTNDVKLPGEKEKRVVTINEVESKLKEIQELSTYSDEYKVTRGHEGSRAFLDNITIPLTKKNVTIECEGIVKVGYDLEKVGVTVDNTSYKIYISLPEASVNDNYVIWDTVNCSEANNILNPIDFEDYKVLMSEIEAEGLADAEKKGIYSKAEEQMEKLIELALSGIDDYEVQFVKTEES